MPSFFSRSRVANVTFMDVYFCMYILGIMGVIYVMSVEKRGLGEDHVVQDGQPCARLGFGLCAKDVRREYFVEDFARVVE